MAFSNASYLREIREGIGRFEPRLMHFCLVAPVEVVHARLRARGADPTKEAWQYRRASECCAVHDSEPFSAQISAVDRTPEDIARDLLQRLLSS